MTDIPTPDSLRPGDLVGPWRVEGYAGRGTYGVVYRARRAGHPGSVSVALKMALFPDDPRSRREVELLSRFHHPAVPRLTMLSSGVAAAAVVLVAVGMQWMSREPREEAYKLARAEVQGDGAAPEAVTRGLGDSMPTTRVSSEGLPVALEAKVIAEELPDEPLPNQRRAPCRGYEQVEINGGCWHLLRTIQPPCGDDAYEWKGACYYPILGQAKPRTSKTPR